MPECPPDVASMLRLGSRQPLVPSAERRGEASGRAIDRHEIERLIPHRDTVLLVDGIVSLNRDAATIVCHYDLGGSASIFDQHFPGKPIWPAVLQVEAIGQAGLCLVRLLEGVDRGGDRREASGGFALTHILGAEFVRPVTPSARLEIVARVLPDGLFTIVVGQCIQHDAVCCVAALRGITEERSA